MTFIQNWYILVWRSLQGWFWLRFPSDLPKFLTSRIAWVGNRRTWPCLCQPYDEATWYQLPRALPTGQNHRFAGNSVVEASVGQIDWVMKGQVPDWKVSNLCNQTWCHWVVTVLVVPCTTTRNSRSMLNCDKTIFQWDGSLSSIFGGNADVSEKTNSLGNLFRQSPENLSHYQRQTAIFFIWWWHCFLSWTHATSLHRLAHSIPRIRLTFSGRYGTSSN